MSPTEKTVNQVQDYAPGFLKEKLSLQLSFHAYQHTLEVISAVKEIAEKCVV